MQREVNGKNQLVIPVKPTFYELVRVAAAKQGKTIAGFSRELLEKAVKETKKEEKYGRAQ